MLLKEGGTGGSWFLAFSSSPPEENLLNTAKKRLSLAKNMSSSKTRWGEQHRNIDMMEMRVNKIVHVNDGRTYLFSYTSF